MNHSPGSQSLPSVASGCVVDGSQRGCDVNSPPSGSLPIVVGANEPVNTVDEGIASNRSVSPLSFLANIMPAGGLLATGFAMASTVIGAGVLGLPSAFADVGYIMGTLYILLVTAETVYSMRLLVLVAEKTGLGSYEEMARVLMNKYCLYFVIVLRFVHSFGAQIAYIVTIGDLLEPILADSSAPDFLKEQWGRRVLTIGIWLLLFLPVALPRQVNALRYVSTVGLTMIVMLCICVIVHSAQNGDRPKLDAVVTGNRSISGLGVFIFSYMCQVNTLDCVREMTHCTLSRFTACATVSMAVCGTLYFLTGLMGYLDFGGTVNGSLLNMYKPLEDKQFLICYIGVLIKITASYGLLSNAGRSAAYSLLGWDPLTVAFWKHATFAVIMAFTSLIAGLFIPKVTMVFGFLGGLCGGFIAFIFPALFYMYAGNWTFRSVGAVNYIATYLVLAAGVLAIVFGTGSTIYDAVPDASSNDIIDGIFSLCR